MSWTDVRNRVNQALSLEAQGHYVVVVRPDEVTPIWRLLGDMITQVWQQDARTYIQLHHGSPASRRDRAS